MVKLKNTNYIIMTATAITLSIFSMYFFDSYLWNYDNKVYQFEIANHKYDLKNPKMRWDLPRELEEISGLSFYSKKQTCLHSR